MSPARSPEGLLQRGFTLIEIMVVVVIIGLLAAIVAPNLIGNIDKAAVTRAKGDIRSIETALNLYRLDNFRYPTTDQGLQALVTNPSIRGYNPGGYLNKVPTDPWQNPFIYTHPSTHGKDYDLESYGKDGEDGGTTHNADIESWNLN